MKQSKGPLNRSWLSSFLKLACWVCTLSSRSNFLCAILNDFLSFRCRFSSLQWTWLPWQNLRLFQCKWDQRKLLNWRPTLAGAEESSEVLHNFTKIVSNSSRPKKKTNSDGKEAKSTFTCMHKMVFVQTSLVKRQCILKIEGHYKINKRLPCLGKQAEPSLVHIVRSIWKSLDHLVQVKKTRSAASELGETTQMRIYFFPLASFYCLLGQFFTSVSVFAYIYFSGVQYHSNNFGECSDAGFCSSHH